MTNTRYTCELGEVFVAGQVDVDSSQALLCCHTIKVSTHSSSPVCKSQMVLAVS
jgi:hypothetical protein